MSIGRNIAENRRRMGLTQQQLAERVGVSFQAVSSWERGECTPDTEKLRLIATALDTGVARLLGEEPGSSFGEVEDRLFDEGRMYTQLKAAANARHLPQTSRALAFAREKFAGQMRQGKGNVPCFSPALLMGCHALAMGIAEDDVLAAILLHDVCGDCGVAAEDLPAGDAVRAAVRLLTAAAGQEPAACVEMIRMDRIACLVMALERCSALSTMASHTGREEMARLIRDTQEHVMPLLEALKNDWPEFYDAAFLLKYHMKSVMESLKRTI